MRNPDKIKNFTDALIKLKEQKHYEELGYKNVSDYLSFKLFLLERELGYSINKDFNGLVLVERLKMFDRFMEMRNNQITEKELEK